MRFSNIQTRLSLIWISVLTFIPGLMMGQSDILNQYIQEGLTNNLQIAHQQMSIGQQQLRYEEAKAKYLPTLALKADYLLSDGGRDIVFPIGDLLNPAYGALNEITGSGAFPTLDNQQFQLTPNNYLDARISLSQPIFNAAIKQNKLTQAHLKDMEEARLAAFKQVIRKDIQVAYFNYLKTFEVLAVYDSTENLLREVYSFNEKLVRYQKATADATANVAFELAKLASDRAGVLQQQALAKAYFNTLLNRPLDSPIQVDNQLTTSAPLEISLLELQESAMTSRQELNQLDAAIEANRSLTKLNQQAFLPSLGMEATAGYQGEDEFFTNDQRLVTVGFGLNWTLYEGGQRKKRVQVAQLERAKLEKDKERLQQQISMELINSWHAVKAASQQLMAEEVAVNSAEKVFDIIDKRYRNEQALLIEYLDARTKVTQAKISLSIAKFDYLIRQAELEAAAASSDIE